MGKPVLADPFDVDALLAFHQANFGSARMEGEEDPPKTDPAGGAPKDPPGEKQLPQSQVNEIVAARTKEAKDKALQEVATMLGVPLEEAKRIVKERQEADERNQSELDKERKRAADAESDRDAKTTQAAKDLHQERSDRALVALGIPDEDEKLARLRGMLTVEVGASREDIKKDAEKLKADFPALFGEQPTGSGGRVPGSDPGRKPGGGKVSDTAYSRGMERAKQRSSGPEADNRVEPLPIPGVTATA